LQNRAGEIKEVVPDRRAGPFPALLGQLEVKLAQADILISTLDLVSAEKLNHSARLSLQQLWFGLLIFGFPPLKYLMDVSVVAPLPPSERSALSSQNEMSKTSVLEQL